MPYFFAMRSQAVVLVLLGISSKALALPEPVVGTNEVDCETTTPTWKTKTKPAWTTHTTHPWGGKTSSTCQPITTTTTDWQTTTVVQTSISTTTTTATTTLVSTVTATCSAPSQPLPTEACLVTNPLCASTGWTVDYYANPFAGFGYPPSGLGPGYYISEHLKPLGSGTTDETYFPQNMDPTGDPVVYPGTSFDNGNAPYYVGWTIDVAGITIDANNFTLVYSGLYKAPATGSFSVCSEADNIVDVFFGSTSGAFPCGGKPSADATPAVSGSVSTGGNYNNPTSCFSESLIEGFYYPIRFVMANFQGPSALGFTITPPGGTASYVFDGTIFPPSCALL